MCDDSCDGVDWIVDKVGVANVVVCCCDGCCGGNWCCCFFANADNPPVRVKPPKPPVSGLIWG